MVTVTVRWLRPILGLLSLTAFFALAGCGGSFKLVPVNGTVYGTDGKPLKSGGLNFIPDAGKGNTTKVSVMARIEDGKYEAGSMGIKGTEAGKGAPPGWYKVTLLGNLPGGKDEASISVPQKFTNASTTPWSIEIVDNPQPGQYDLHMK